MRNLGTYVNDFHRFMASAGKVIEIYYEAPRIVDRVDAAENKEKLRGDIEFRNVTFSIGDKKILDNISPIYQ